MVVAAVDEVFPRGSRSSPKNHMLAVRIHDPADPGAKLNLEALVQAIPCFYFDRSRITAVVAMSLERECTALIFSTGAMNVTGGSSLEEIESDTAFYLGLMREAGFPYEIRSKSLRNILSTIKVSRGRGVDLCGLSHEKGVDYLPEQINLCCFKPCRVGDHPKRLTSTIFPSGAVNLMGFLNAEEELVLLRGLERALRSHLIPPASDWSEGLEASRAAAESAKRLLTRKRTRRRKHAVWRATKGVGSAVRRSSLPTPYKSDLCAPGVKPTA